MQRFLMIGTAARAPLFALLLVLVTAPALAYERKGPYAGGGIGSGSISLSDEGVFFSNNVDESVLVLEGHGGYRFNSYFALEGKLLGVANSVNYTEEEAAFAAFSGRVLVLAPVSNTVDLFALAGLYTGSSSVGYSDTEDESGLVYGGGIQMNFGSRGNLGVRIEYELYDIDVLLTDVQAFTVAFQYNFFR